MGEIALSFQHVHKSFFGVPVLRDINIDIKRGHILGLIGENGAGKSTLMYILGGVVPFENGEIYLDGMTNVLSEPEFSESSEARLALHILEERSLLENLLASTVMNIDVGGIQVLIGGEGTWEELRQCSIVLARYGDPNTLTGSLGVLGPIRMPYDRTISTVRFVANVLSDLVSETLAV